MSFASLRAYRLPAEDALGPRYDALFADALEQGFFRDRAWLENYRAHGVLPGEQVELFAVEDAMGGEVVGLVPVVYTRLLGAYPRARAYNFMLLSEVVYAPWVAAAGSSEARVLGAVVDHLRASARRYDVLRFGPLDPDAAATAELVAVLRARRHALRDFTYFHDTFASTVGLSSAQFMAQRPQEMLDTLQWAAQALFKDDGLTFHLLTHEDEMEAAWAHYMEVIDANQVDIEPEPFPYLHGAMRAAAAAGALRVGVLSLKGEPAGIQVWIASARQARCLRLWAVQRYRGQAMFDDVITERMIAHLIDIDQVEAISFGGVSPEFRLRWGFDVRRRIGVSAFHLRTWRGIRNAVRHLTARWVKAALARIGVRR